ncbi:MAG TPA: hypothetical protein VD969_17120 [Symbiobacteriaceae bacterium]|nr:hypothetical protein [Symbiobacteriaceae bacterium]
MGARAILTEMRDLLAAQVEAVVAGDHQRVYAGAMRHEELLRDLEGADMDLTPEELQPLDDQIALNKVKLTSLLSAQGARVDYLLRLIIGRGPQKSGGYPQGLQERASSARRINRRT